ncbi:hypothetical protein [Brevundimonas sp.]|uniref:hypothetical protein n=1 Tax=Brevundimonas sp. TaxID=1871086 RepID=UPI0027379E11|nr:hypothetical protein [Brevundimonas sp.]
MIVTIVVVVMVVIVVIAVMTGVDRGLPGTALTIRGGRDDRAGLRLVGEGREAAAGLFAHWTVHFLAECG